MTDSAAAAGQWLQALAAGLGVQREYVSAAGETVRVADDSLRALAAALGFAARTGEEVEASLQALDRARQRPLPPVVLVQEGALVDVPWSGAGDDEAPVEWRFVHEDGSVHVGVAGEGRRTSVPASASTAGPASAAASSSRAASSPLSPAPTPPSSSSPTSRDGPAPSACRLHLGIAPTGYHRVEVTCGGVSASCTVIVVPPRAYTPPDWSEAGRRDWALTAQLYALRSPSQWGIGDLSDLGALGVHAAEAGAAAIGLNPLHALFPADPRHLSPYSPSSRAFLNPIYIDVEAVPEWAGCEAAQALAAEPAFQRQLQELRAGDFVDHEAVWSLKQGVLKNLHRSFRQTRSREPQGERAQGFQAFTTQGGEPLRRLAVFEALQQHQVAQGAGLAWRDWPAPYRRPDSPEVAAFASEHAEAVEFAQYLQWEADRQLGAQAEALRHAGMAIGLYRDVAVGVDPNGAEAWGDPSLLVADASVGAPPDLYNPKGQNWGLTPFNPIALEARAYEPFIAAIRANMRHAGAIRIDHVIGLQRLYWVPRGEGAAAGAYVSYPYEALAGIIALESWRHRCLVVGEDLGTVPEGFREDAEQRGLLSYRLLMFEREGGDGAFLPPSEYPALAAAAVSTHDLPTLAGLWAGRDLEWRRQLALYPTAEAAERETAFRAATREALVDALVAHAGLPAGAAASLRESVTPEPAVFLEFVEAAHRFLAAAPSRLLLVQIEDLAGEIEQMNLPATVHEHPNWRRKLRPTIDALFADPGVRRIATTLQRERRTLAGRSP